MINYWLNTKNTTKKIKNMHFICNYLLRKVKYYFSIDRESYQYINISNSK